MHAGRMVKHGPHSSDRLGDMCRLYGFRANEPTKVECSLVLAQNALLAQSRGDMRGKAHADGWGIAYYENSVPQVLKSETAAFETLHFSTAAERVFSETVLAHVRRATVSEPSLANTHPFHRGPWVFAHNGTVRAFDSVAPQIEADTPNYLLEARLGQTDSELAFLWLLWRMSEAGIDIGSPCDDLEALVSIVGDSVRCLAQLSEKAGAEKPAELNFMITDGHVLLASRWHNSLYVVIREGIHDCEICGIPHVHHADEKDYRAVVVASEPITSELWQEVPEAAIVAVDRESRARIHEAVSGRDALR